MAGEYCRYTSTLEDGNIHKVYHDFHYGFPLSDDNESFGRFILEINQAGLSWDTILKKQGNFRKAYKNFDIKKVAAFKEKDRERLLSDTGIIRNRLKINAAIENAKEVIRIQQEYGSFRNWLDKHHPKTLNEWVGIFKKRFRFVGKEIVSEMLMSTGYLPGAHSPDCPVYKKILSLNPPFLMR